MPPHQIDHTSQDLDAEYEFKLGNVPMVKITFPTFLMAHVANLMIL